MSTAKRTNSRSPTYSQHMSKKSIRSRIEELETELPTATTRWVVSIIEELPEDDSSTRAFVVESVHNGQPVFKNPEKVVQRGNGVMKKAKGANVPEPPEEFTHVATGPKGVTSPVVVHWDIYADLETHTPPESVSVEELPVE